MPDTGGMTKCCSVATLLPDKPFEPPDTIGGHAEFGGDAGDAITGHGGVVMDILVGNEIGSHHLRFSHHVTGRGHNGQFGLLGVGLIGNGNRFRQAAQPGDRNGYLGRRQPVKRVNGTDELLVLKTTAVTAASLLLGLRTIKTVADTSKVS